jgi:hypothetical protein
MSSSHLKCSTLTTCAKLLARQLLLACTQCCACQCQLLSHDFLRRLSGHVLRPACYTILKFHTKNMPSHTVHYSKARGCCPTTLVPSTQHGHYARGQPWYDTAGLDAHHAQEAPAWGEKLLLYGEPPVPPVNSATDEQAMLIVHSLFNTNGRPPAVPQISWVCTQWMRPLSSTCEGSASYAWPTEAARSPPSSHACDT